VTPWRRRCAAALAAMQLAVPLVAAEIPTPEGYRLDDYRAPVPDRVPGGRTLDTAAAKALWERGEALWIDVLPAPRRPAGQAPGAIWKPLPHRAIPGSLWLPEVGRGALSPAWEAYFRERLEAATGGRRDRPIVFYCLSECWMSWNATRRAAAYGYTALHWYPLGIDGWQAEGLPTAVIEPTPGAPE
jgi:PQQ-dependent catabolism-associated CXXCW motif protein